LVSISPPATPEISSLAAERAADYPAEALGAWTGATSALAHDALSQRRLVGEIDRPLFVVDDAGQVAMTTAGRVTLAEGRRVAGSLPLRAYAPAMGLSQLGDASFRADHHVRLAYMTGSMANGIASVEVVEAAARAGMLASFGAAGLSVREIERAIDELGGRLGRHNYAFNLIHSPNEPAHEGAVVELYLRRGVRRVEASAYLDLTLPVVRYRVHGIHRDASGRVVAPNRIIAKASRVEVAQKWFSPPPAKFLAQLVERGEITAAQAALAERIPMAQDLTAEADSGGHTDNRPLVTLMPTMIALRDRLQAAHAYEAPLRVGAAGGIGTPHSAAAAFAMGAAYIVTGTINQACVESGTSAAVREMLAAAQQADVAMAPAADMFEMGVRLQVLKRGTMFAMRAAKLYELYRAHDSLEAVPAAERQSLEKSIFRQPLGDVWRQTREYFEPFDRAQVERAERDPKHKLALVFRWYLGLSSHWANRGEPTRAVDYQIWCGPAMGAFNEWTRGTFLEPPENRRVADVGLNLMYGAAVCLRGQMLRSQGVDVALSLEPRPASELEQYV
jgi:trans-AT polyketide synthase/acyltransferase/oxidoreductase domain-containing protein